MVEDTIYKIFRVNEWKSLKALGFFSGSADDARDGFIHFSTADQLTGTRQKHFAEDDEIVIAEIDVAQLDDLLWEPSRGGGLFPHLYGTLPFSAVIRHWPSCGSAQTQQPTPA